jgi:hypothetical protein
MGASEAHVDRLAGFVSYCTSLASSEQKLKDLNDHKPFQQFLQERASWIEVDGKDLQTILRTPFYYIQQYANLLNLLLPCWKTESGRERCQRLITQIAKTTVGINDARVQEMELLVLEKLQSDLEMRGLVRSGRFLLKEGVVYALEKGGPSPRYLYLLSDMCLIVLKKRSKQKLLERINFTADSELTPASTGIPNSFELSGLVQVSEDETMSVRRKLATATFQERAEWISAFTKGRRTTALERSVSPPKLEQLQRELARKDEEIAALKALLAQKDETINQLRSQRQ